MKIIIADNAGFCFGVKRAMDMSMEVLNENNDSIHSLGPLIHNRQAVDKLNRLGLRVANSIDEIENGKVIVRSHGIPYEIYEKISKMDLELIDCTCPYVKSIHKKVNEYWRKGYKIVIIGDKDHPEVIGINGWCNNEGIVINTEDEATNLPNLNKICIVSQTTNTLDKFNTLSKIVSQKSSNVEIFNTICNATNLRQSSCKEVAKKVEAMIVIGGYHSSNTNKLVEISKKYCQNVYHIETVNDLSFKELSKYEAIGLTAGASTPDWIIKEVIEKMENINNDEMMKAIEDSMVYLQRGSIVKGNVILVTDNEVMVNVGYKSDGIIERTELSNDPNISPKELFKEGDEVDVYVIKLDDGEGNVVLSSKRVEDVKNWDEVEKIYENQEKVECKVIEVVKGGVIASVNGLRGFIPASLLSVKYVRNLDEYKGKTLLAKIIDFNRNKNKIILSRKEIEKEEIEEIKNKVWDSLEIGNIIEGEVKRITNFGAFVDIGGIDGLVHISDLSWNKIKHPSEVVSEGEKIKVEVLDFNRENNRISLGLKQILPRPWDVFMDSCKVGDIVKGEIVNLLDFGAFVRLDSGVDGLVHISQISNEHVNRPSDKLKVGEKVKVKIMDIDEEKERISLSIKEALEEDKDEYIIENKEIDSTIEERMKNK
ncbi:bifunctional 4-hydroxy-3-methylbut-2-enyl diphosphate reductase/30S ribosomal protein S1 [Anaerosalibacter bizertensis]|uniref:4-hydroxy-3-methylbut-2-enyl diphosphate reductase n=1 Tax=Anaerosalibacter bizertensis TaxID=932217 RepID=A0A844FG21_9FIRM|nr:bifunctional 4-hydroxy-3-methylbut-2-enyl diphosphate reductase/30S ribosomal protein S1 [Anaerosalibacter bizertensis]MBV1818471.1 bifunctional 4-hydroxy-3-methylbut-2-enyl diphosphate reductase/30S ribosomal protein S1 [Bacteroidales bacterium MSK.15.36]MBU5293211.1 bifunctional 4-hydroxy-3-methylbut-2-enyl diphosphate reductase/30S ribosomal protein S1 [Anaerosalibacter bizertensis]MCB5559689.1 bifunctional 4-hydroxy-3-methylbut-2-enyl diphosphate reductase/30S ribosomal protein S1 [Anaero